MNHERCLADEIHIKRSGGDETARYRLNGAQTVFLVDGVERWGGNRSFGPYSLTSLHGAKTCGNHKSGVPNRHCVIHNPSPHAMRKWPLIWREGLVGSDSALLRMCPHYRLHPDPDYVYWSLQEDNQAAIGHSCCSKCWAGGRCVSMTSPNDATSWAPKTEMEDFMSHL